MIPAAGGPIEYSRPPSTRTRRSSTGTAAACSSARRSGPRSYLFSIDPATKAIRKYTPVGAVDRLRLQPDARRPVGGVHRGRRSTLGEIYVAPVATALEAAQAHRHDGADRGWTKQRASKWSRGRARTARRSKACCTSRPDSRPGGSIRCSSSFTAGRPATSRPHGVLQHVDLSDRHLDGEGRAGARAELSRQRRLRRSVPLAQRPQPRRRRRLGRAVGHRSSDRGGDRRSRSRGDDGLEPGRLYLRLPRRRTTARGSRRCRSAPASRTG